jgi:hypothetical protein
MVFFLLSYNSSPPHTGFMLINYCLRANTGFPYLPVYHWLEMFRHLRAPGIYKQEYVVELFKRNNEQR